MATVEYVAMLVLIAMLCLVAVCLIANIRLKKPISEKVILALISALVAAYTYLFYGR